MFPWYSQSVHRISEQYRVGLSRGGRSSLKRFPVLAFESSDADLVAENLNRVLAPPGKAFLLSTTRHEPVVSEFSK
jgi:hypothetical protein